MSNVLEKPIANFVETNLIAASADLSVTDAVKTMTESNVDSLLIFEKDEVIGIVTQKDVLAEVVAKGLDPKKTSIKEVGKKPLIKIPKTATVLEAIDMLRKHDIRRLIVTDQERTIGLISQKKIIGNLGDKAVELPELEIPGKINCPYCTDIFDDKSSLVKHIDNVHLGMNL